MSSSEPAGGGGARGGGVAGAGGCGVGVEGTPSQPEAAGLAAMRDLNMYVPAASSQPGSLTGGSFAKKNRTLRIPLPLICKSMGQSRDDGGTRRGVGCAGHPWFKYSPSLLLDRQVEVHHLNVIGLPSRTYAFGSELDAELRGCKIEMRLSINLCSTKQQRGER